MEKRKNQKGFTLVELVIVIAVIAILAAVLIPTFITVIGDANKSAALQEGTNLKTEILQLYEGNFDDFCKDYCTGEGKTSPHTITDITDKTPIKEGDKATDAPKFSDFIAVDKLEEVAVSETKCKGIIVSYAAATGGKITYKTNGFTVEITAKSVDVK